jgi:hypothetical protein
VFGGGGSLPTIAPVPRLPAPVLPSSSVSVTFKAAPFGLSLHDKDAAAAAATGCAVSVLAVAPSSPAVGAVKAGYGVASVGGTNARTLSNVEVMGLLKAAVATLGSSPLVVEFMPPAGGSSSPAVAAPPPLLPPTPALVAPAAAAAPAPSSSVSVTFKAAPFGLSLHDKDAAAAAATGCAVTLLAVAPSSPAVGAVKAGYGVASVGGTNARTLSNVEVMGLLKAAVATLGSSPLVVEFMPPAGGSSSPAVAAPPPLLPPTPALVAPAAAAAPAPSSSVSVTFKAAPLGSRCTTRTRRQPRPPAAPSPCWPWRPRRPRRAR